MRTPRRPVAAVTPQTRPRMHGRGMFPGPAPAITRKLSALDGGRRGRVDEPLDGSTRMADLRLARPAQADERSAVISGKSRGKLLPGPIVLGKQVEIEPTLLGRCSNRGRAAPETSFA